MEQPQTDHWPSEPASLELMRPLLIGTGDPTPLPFESVNPGLYHQQPVIVRVSDSGTDPIPSRALEHTGTPEGHHLSQWPSGDHLSHFSLPGVYSTVPMDPMDSHLASLHALGSTTLGPAYGTHYSSILEYPPAPFEDPSAYYQNPHIYSPWPGYGPPGVGAYFPPLRQWGAQLGPRPIFRLRRRRRQFITQTIGHMEHMR